MKKNVIALFVAAVMVVCSMGTTTAKAVETDEEVEMSFEESSEGESVQVMEEGTTESEEAVDQDECIGVLAESTSEGFEESTETKSVQEPEETLTETAAVEEQNTVEETLTEMTSVEEQIAAEDTAAKGEAESGTDKRSADLNAVGSTEASKEEYDSALSTEKANGLTTIEVTGGQYYRYVYATTYGNLSFIVDSETYCRVIQGNKMSNAGYYYYTLNLYPITGGTNTIIEVYDNDYGKNVDILVVHSVYQETDIQIACKEKDVAVSFETIEEISADDIFVSYNGTEPPVSIRLNSITLDSIVSHGIGVPNTYMYSANMTLYTTGSYNVVLSNDLTNAVFVNIPVTIQEHEYDNGVITRKATCQKKAILTKTCNNCGDSISEEVGDFAEHTWSEEFTIDKEPTCAEEGSEAIHCYICGAIKEDTVQAIPKTAHDYTELVELNDATCTEEGSEVIACVECGDRITEVIPAKGHRWENEYTIDVEPTYTEEGSKSIHCEICNAVKEGSETTIPKLLKDIDDLTIYGIDNKVYTGKAITQNLVIKDRGKILTDGKDYTVSYMNNINVGTASITIRGIGSYKGSDTETFMILPGKTTRGDMFNLANNVKVTWKEVPGAKYYKVYREGLTNPWETQDEPVIVTSGLVGWDKQPGLTNGNAYRYRIVASLTGIGEESGDSPISYSKIMYRLKTVVIRSVKNTAPGKVTVKYDKTTSGDSYVLQYGERADMVGAKTKVVLGANNTSYVIGGLKKGKTYYISIRVRKKVDGIDYYTTFGVPKKITISK